MVINLMEAQLRDAAQSMEAQMEKKMSSSSQSTSVSSGNIINKVVRHVIICKMEWS
ncbi:unnamed protein product [Sphenostylis stenocarpa]|uniref:Uncharacterized protein n=1 Tax=Sphenostylis stenocarpa TaxID=92480 RepID=A0AA86SFX6_9FABA|nr:unnamed protein product [Sphenostylis stenocarpa]